MVLELAKKGTQDLPLKQRDVRETANIGSTPTISDFTASQHNHSNAAGGGNTTHQAGDGSDHTDVATNTTHSGGDGSDHADVATNTAAKHTQNTDTALGSGAVAADHGTASTDQIVNVSYGTGSPPTASTTTEGSLFVKYVA